ncbi:extracellular solute-binding protein [Paenibacillus piri]|uniref:Extracellular solute-binding protein n=1 Tax=Paenibacillus piri TaxID=2547395 RepID=A0A4R5KX00_9BACL|nr:extracellular solute-binding protein [Paenibacillus piri]TDF99510.1 extracellular solute-binding protein [Paenibacillus piri]
MKKSMKFKTGIAVVATVGMASTMLAGCNTSASKPSASSPPEKGAGTPAAGDAAKQKINFKILVPKAAHEMPYDKMDVFVKLEEKTNVHIDWDNPPAENFKERVNLVMASGDLPDMIVQTPITEVLKYAQMGAIIDLNDLIEKNAPNLTALMKKYPNIKKWISTPEGKIYYLPRLYADDESSRPSRINNPLQIRQDWLEKLNLKEPVTTDEWYTVLKAFKEKDPNGNGKMDEIPYSTNGIGFVRNLSRAWDVEDTFYIPKGSKEIRFGPIEDRFKEALTWINQLYKEGLLDKEFATNDEKAFQSKVSQNLVGSYRGLLGGHLRAFNETLPKTIPGFKLVGTIPMKGPHGDQREPLGGIVGGAHTVITKSNKNPAEAVKWLDYFYGPEGSAFLSFGPEEGKTFTKEPGGRYHYSDFVQKNPNGMSAKQAIGTFSPIQSAWPVLHHPDTTLEMNPSFNVDAMNKIAPYALDGIPELGFKKEDDEVRRQVMNDVQTYVDEMIIKFIMGNEPLSNWDAYVKRVKSMGIDKVLKIYNDTYTAWSKM